MPLEKSLRKPQRLWPRKKQFLSLLNFFLSLRVEFVHFQFDNSRATNCSRARPPVQSGASTLCRSKASALRNLMLQLMDRGSSSATSLARAAFGADAAGAGANDFVAAADGTGDAHEDAAERYCHAER